MMIQTFPGGGRVFSSRGRPTAPVVPIGRVRSPLAPVMPVALPSRLKVVKRASAPPLPPPPQVGSLIPVAAAEKIGPLVRLVAEVSGLSAETIRSTRRTPDVVKPRAVVCFLARRFTSYSLPEIGRRIGGRDHTTVLHACRKMAAIVEKIGEPEENTPEAWAAHLLNS